MSEGSSENNAELLATIKPMIGVRKGPYLAWNPVTRTHIWQWCSAMGDNNPLYLDDNYRSSTEFSADKVVAPPTTMQMWTMRDVHGKLPAGSTDAEQYEILQAMQQHGYNGVMAVSYDQTFHRYLEEGDTAKTYSTIVNVSDEKNTAVGKGFFVTERAEFLDQNDECFAEALITYYQFQAPQKPKGATKSSAPGKILRVHPIENQDNAFYWQGLRDGKLLIQKCSDCGELRHPPQPMCEHCQSLKWETIESTGKGTVYTYTVMHYPEIPPFDYPNSIILVELEEGVRLATQLIDCKPEDIAIGMAVEMEIREVQDDLSLPLFKPAKR